MIRVDRDADVVPELAALRELDHPVPDVRISVTRIMIGFVIASAMAMPMVSSLRAYRFWEAALEPLVDFIRYMPVVALVPADDIPVGWDGRHPEVPHHLDRHVLSSRCSSSWTTRLS